MIITLVVISIHISVVEASHRQNNATTDNTIVSFHYLPQIRPYTTLFSDIMNSNHRKAHDTSLDKKHELIKD